MKTNQIRKGRSIPVSIFIGIAISILLTLIVAGIAAALLASERIGIQTLSAIASITVVIATGVGSWLSTRLAGKQRMLVCLITGAGYFLLLLAMTAMFFGGSYEQVPIRLLFVLLSSALVGFLGMKGKRNNKIKRLKRTYR